MKKLLIIVWFVLFNASAFAQKDTIIEMRWGVDYQVYLKTRGDSAQSWKIDELFHAAPINLGQSTGFTFYPVNLDKTYVESVRTRDSDNEFTFAAGYLQKNKPITLWSSLYYNLGGGWEHFINSILYSLETRNLELTAPYMVRPISKWKPNPPTETWKRTRKWKYYVPVSQKEALKEYKIRLETNTLGDLGNIPKAYIDLFLATSDKQYKKIQKAGRFHDLAKIDLVKLFLGMNYLGEAQIKFISNRVQNAIVKYAENRAPSVIIFEQYEAAVAMRLTKDGYVADKMVFKNEEKLSVEEIEARTELVNRMIENINANNRFMFEKRLKGQAE